MLSIPHQTDFYRGKVRDVYTIQDQYLLMMVSDRISAFDQVLPRTIPYKGQVLNQIAARNLDATADIVPNWKLSVPLPQATLGLRCTPYPVEMVIRAHLTGHAWRIYAAGGREICGLPLPEGMKENDPFPEPLITPTTKAQVGHDEDISRDQILSSGLVPEEEYLQLEAYTRALFRRGQQMATDRGLILVDTKYEFGNRDGKIYLIDEVHTPDSSRFFYLDGFEERQRSGQRQRQLSKEFVREWLMENGFQGREGEQIPEMTDEVLERISLRYRELYEQVLGEPFQKQDLPESELQQRLSEAIEHLLQTAPSSSQK